MNIFNDFERPANDFTGIVGALQFTNTSQYLGYGITTQAGLQIDRRKPTGEDALTITRSFVTIYAGLGSF